MTNKYYYKDGTEVKKGDICFYSEYDGINMEYHYADSINVIEERYGDFFPRAKVITMDEAKTFEDYDEPIENTISLRWSLINGFVDCFTKIGHIDTESHILNSEYAMKNYSVLK